MNEYSLEELIKTFKDHDIKFKKSREESIISFKENNPNTELPEWYTETFSICFALHSICKEILELKSDSSSKAPRPASLDSETKQPGSMSTDLGG